MAQWHKRVTVNAPVVALISLHFLTLVTTTTKRNVDFRHSQLSGETQRRAAATSMHKCSYLTLDYVDLQNHDFKLHWTVVLKN